MNTLPNMGADLPRDFGEAGSRLGKAKPSDAELKAARDGVTAEHGERATVTKLAASYGVTTVTIRKWLEQAGLRTSKRRIPPRPITTPCPCGAVATTRYKGQDPPLCFKCYMRTYAADTTSAFRRTAREYIAEVKRNAVCHDCGGKFPPSVYQFDHVPERGPKLFNLGNGDYSIAAVTAEIAKCDIVCANCHAVRTWITRDKPWMKKRAVPAPATGAPLAEPVRITGAATLF